MSNLIKIVEAGPRDGLQNEPKTVPLATKIELVDRLSGTGLQHIEAGSFVSPEWVPQMADSDEVLRQIKRRSGVTYSALTPNLKGYKNAHEVNADEIAIFIAASESFSQKNLNGAIAESLANLEPVVQAAKADAVPVRGYVSCITHCPFEGKIAPQKVARLARQLVLMGCHEVSLGDTIGAAKPGDINNLLEAVLSHVPAEKLAGHFHDTNNNALFNVEASLAHGLTTFDSSIAGLGGCPYAPGAPGNLNTVKLVEYLHGRGFETGVDVAGLKEVERFINNAMINTPL